MPYGYMSLLYEPLFFTERHSQREVVPANDLDKPAAGTPEQASRALHDQKNLPRCLPRGDAEAA